MLAARRSVQGSFGLRSPNFAPDLIAACACWTGAEGLFDRNPSPDAYSRFSTMSSRRWPTCSICGPITLRSGPSMTSMARPCTADQARNSAPGRRSAGPGAGGRFCLGVAACPSPAQLHRDSREDARGAGKRFPRRLRAGGFLALEMQAPVLRLLPKENRLGAGIELARIFHQ